MNKKILAFILCGIVATSAMTSCGKKLDFTSNTSGDPSSNVGSDAEDATKAPPENVDIMNFTAPQNGDTIIEMNIRDYGTVKFRLFPEYADKGVENFVGLANDGYYDGLTFHRVIRDFMIQGGDPLGNGTGGKSLWGSEFDGGTDAHLIHVPGAVVYANSTGPASNTSQFYIVTGNEITDDDFTMFAQYDYSFSEKAQEMYKKVGGVPYLDGKYTIFGQVFEGLDIIYQIQYAANNADDKPLSDVIVDSVKVTEYNGEELKWYISDYSYNDPTEKEIENFTKPRIGEEIVCMNIKDYGTVKIKVFSDILPEASENFVELARKGYYDGLTFHRVIQDFMIQGGDPNGDGTGGECLWGDKFDGGKYYNLIHAAGAVAYANSGQYGNFTASDGSQFYIVTGQTYSADDMLMYNGETDSAKKVYQTIGGDPFLDGNYTVFGQVIDGLDIIFKIHSVNTDENDKPTEDVIIESVTVEEYDGSDIRWYLSDYDEDSQNTTNTDDSEDEETEGTTAEGTTEE